LELSALAAYKLYKDEDVPAGGIITGIGKIRGYVCFFLLVYCQGAFTNYVDKTR
jgi:acetyl-CoA carboxylase carboxyltransferase component